MSTVDVEESAKQDQGNPLVPVAARLRLGERIGENCRLSLQSRVAVDPAKARSRRCKRLLDGRAVGAVLKVSRRSERWVSEPGGFLARGSDGGSGGAEVEVSQGSAVAELTKRFGVLTHGETPTLARVGRRPEVDDLLRKNPRGLPRRLGVRLIRARVAGDRGLGDGDRGQRGYLSERVGSRIVVPAVFRCQSATMCGASSPMVGMFGDARAGIQPDFPFLSHSWHHRVIPELSSRCETRGETP